LPNSILNVLVTAVGGGGHGEQILKALRQAAPGNYRLFGGDMNPQCPQLALVDEAFMLPPAAHSEFIDAVLAICSKFGIQAVFHGCEPELLAYSTARRRFEQAGILLPINRADVIQLCMDKLKTSEFLEREGFAPLRYRVLEDPANLDEIDWFPLVVKPFKGTGASKDVFIVQSMKQLRGIAQFLEVSAEKPLMMQEYVGTDEQEFTVGVLHDLDGAFINSVVLRRELKSALNLRTVVPNVTGRTELGKRLVVSSGISHGEIGHFRDVATSCEKIAAALGVRGAINIQGRVDHTGKFRVFEINPRFSGTTSLRALVGYNEPDVLLRKHLRGEKVETRFAYRTGFILRSLTESVMSSPPARSWREFLPGATN